MVCNLQYIYIVGANVYIHTSTSVEITQQLALWIFDCAKLNVCAFIITAYLVA